MEYSKDRTKLNKNGYYWHRCKWCYGKSAKARIIAGELAQDLIKDGCPDCEFAGPIPEPGK